MGERRLVAWGAKHMGGIATALNSVVALIRIVPFLYALDIETFADLSISLAVAGMLFVLSPRVIDAIDYRYMNSDEFNHDWEKNTYAVALLLQLLFALVASAIVYVCVVHIFHIQSLTLVLAGVGTYTGQLSVAFAAPYFKDRNLFHELQLISFLISFLGLVIAVWLLLLIKSEEYALQMAFFFTPVCLAFFLVFIIFQRIMPNFRNLGREMTGFLSSHKNIFFYGLSNSVIKSMNDYGMLLVLATLSTKVDVAVFSLARSATMPFRAYQTYAQALIYKRFGGREISSELFSDVRASAFRAAGAVSAMCILLAALAYGIEVVYSYEKYPKAYEAIFIMGIAASVTMSAIWTYPFAVKNNLLQERSRAALGRLFVSIGIIVLWPSVTGACIGLLCATVFTRLTFDRKLAGVAHAR